MRKTHFRLFILSGRNEKFLLERNGPFLQGPCVCVPEALSTRYVPSWLSPDAQHAFISSTNNYKLWRVTLSILSYCVKTFSICSLWYRNRDITRRPWHWKKNNYCSWQWGPLEKKVCRVGSILALPNFLYQNRTLFSILAEHAGVCAHTRFLSLMRLSRMSSCFLNRFDFYYTYFIDTFFCCIFSCFKGSARPNKYL